LGRGPDNPLPPHALAAKFANCAARALPPVQVEHVQRRLLRLDDAVSLRSLVGTIATGSIATPGTEPLTNDRARLI
jgi:hypothetical protein